VLADVPSDFGPRPFCSERCKLIDLGNWLGEKYRISRPLQAGDLQAEDLEEDSFELK
jgi:endogenous inhibitor of DNA gyrase (YacG/DUF329 family)